MSNKNKEFETILVDGETIIIPSAETWQAITHDPIFLGGRVHPNIHLITFVAQNEKKFRLGVRWIRNFWSTLPLLIMEDHLQRVQIEYVTCDHCGKLVRIASPTEPTIYYGAVNRGALLDRAYALPRCGCPHCGGVLPRIAIWAELYEEVSDNG
jgi:hypothetical protein